MVKILTFGRSGGSNLAGAVLALFHTGLVFSYCCACGVSPLELARTRYFHCTFHVQLREVGLVLHSPASLSLSRGFRCDI